MATLGGLIKDYRIQKRLSQLEIATKVGWSDTSRLSKIEQGRTYKPSRQVLDRILEALGLSDTQKNELLLFGSYVPTNEEVKKALNEVRELVDIWPYPITITDFTWRCYALNLSAAKTFYVDPNINLFKNNFNFLEVPFIPKEIFPLDIEKGEGEKTLVPFPVFQIAQFKTEHHNRTEDSWYRQLIGRLMKNEKFRQSWAKIDRDSYKKTLIDYEYKVVTGSWLGKKQTLRFHLSSSKLISDPRFQAILYLPADKSTEEFYTSKAYMKAKLI